MHAQFTCRVLSSANATGSRSASTARTCRLAATLLLLAMWPLEAAAALRDQVVRREWRQLSLPGLTIVSDASEAKLRQWAAEIVWFRSALQMTLKIPQALPEKPATLFLFSSESSMRPFLPVIDGKPARMSALFSAGMGGNIGAVPIAGSRFATRDRLFHELTHWYLRRANVMIPLWFEEGVAQAMESFTLQGNGFRVGAPRVEEFKWVRIAGSTSLRPLLAQSQLDYSRAGWKHGATDRFYSESAALTNMLLFGAKVGHLSRFSAYLIALHRGLSPEPAFSAGFGLTLDEAHTLLQTYIRVPPWNILTFPLDREITPDLWQITPLTGAKLDLRMASLLISTNRMDEAKVFLTAVLRASPDDREALELTALSLVRDALTDLSAESTAAAVRAYRAGSRNPWICCSLGFVSAERALPELTDEATGRPITPLAYFQQALDRSPGFKPAYEGVASLVMTKSTVSPRERAILAEALSLFPDSLFVQVATAWLEQLDDNPSGARKRLEHLLQDRSDVPLDARMRIRQIISALPDN